MTRIARVSGLIALVLAILVVVPAPAEAGKQNSGSTEATIVDLVLQTPELTTLRDAVVKAELVDTLANGGPFTVFAPTNEAFEAAGVDPAAIDAATLGAVLTDHVAPGEFNSRFLRFKSFGGERLPTLGGLTLGFNVFPFQVNDANIVLRDIEAANGRVFVIDAVLFDPAPSITDKAIATPALTTLVEAVVKAELAATLDEGGPYTVFAPTNDAFAELGIDPSAVDKDTLTAVLLDHVVPGTFTFQDIQQLRQTGGSLWTLGGLELDFSSKRLRYRVNGERIISGNISVGNGNIFLIDGVLLED